MKKSIVIALVFACSALAAEKETVELVKASTICGSEYTYYRTGAAKVDDSILRWILSYSLSEKDIGTWSFAEDTGTEIKPEALDAFLKGNSKNLKPDSLEILKRMKLAREALAKQRARFDGSAETARDSDVSAAVKTYGQTVRAIIQNLTKNYGVDVKDTGADCN